MADHRQELKSRYDALRRLYDDLHGTTFARQDWHAEVVARRTLGSDERIEHWFLAEPESPHLVSLPEAREVSSLMHGPAEVSMGDAVRSRASPPRTVQSGDYHECPQH
jgi:hypothetical protein